MKRHKLLNKSAAIVSIFAVALSFTFIAPAFARSGRGGGGDENPRIRIRENGLRIDLKRNGDEDNERVRIKFDGDENGLINALGNLNLGGLNLFSKSSSQPTASQTENGNGNKIIQNNNITLHNVATTSVTGTAKISVILTKDNLYDTRIRARVENFGDMQGFVFEGWLVDNESGYKLSLGALREKTDNNVPRMDLNFREFLVNFPIYDKLIITKEPLNDTNPNPATAILEADIDSIETNLILAVSALNGSKEVPPNASTTAVGFGAFVIDVSRNTLRFNISFTGLSGAETGAHIHGFALPGANAPILFTLPLGSPKTGVWNYSEAQEDDILAGKTYVNIHSSVFPDGEIRGQITP